MYIVVLPDILFLRLGTVDNPQTVILRKKHPQSSQKIVKGISQNGNSNMKPIYISHVSEFNDTIKHFNVRCPIM